MEKIFLRPQWHGQHSSGAWPTKEIDHVNGDPGDDRLINLREATHAQNQANRRKGLHSVQKGVKRSRSGNRWEARLIVNQSYRSEEHTSELQSLRHLVC